MKGAAQAMPDRTDRDQDLVELRMRKYTRLVHKTILQKCLTSRRVFWRGPSGKGVATLTMLEAIRCAGGREFNPRPGQYSRVSCSS